MKTEFANKFLKKIKMCESGSNAQNKRLVCYQTHKNFISLLSNKGIYNPQIQNHFISLLSFYQLCYHASKLTFFWRWIGV